ncbi:MAG TPA: hypothetical protein VMZ28_25735 [Kofleriaceae bacterium]|nr:hypothetical protein [Kofleriaceae bacterium]
MLRWLLAIAFVSGCGSSKAPPATGPAAGTAPVTGSPPAAPPEIPPRTRDELAQAVSDFATETATPRAGDAAFLLPPREAELEWINDTGVALQERLERALTLYDDSTNIMKRYSTGASADSAEALLWSESVIRVFGRLATAMVDEYLPTLSDQDPSYAARMEGMNKMRDGAFAMFRASVDTLKARRSPLESRRRLTAVWRLHAPRYAGLWRVDRCAQLVQWVQETLAREDDPALRGDLEAVASAFGACRGR